MTESTLLTSTATQPPTAADLRRATRILAAVILPVGPAVVAVLRFVLPYTTLDSSTDIARGVAAHQGRENLVVWLGFVAALTLVPAVVLVARVTARSAPRLTAAAVLLLVPAYLSLAFLVSSDASALYAAKHGLSTAVAADMYNGTHPVVMIAGILFVVGHVLGTVLLGVALLRSGAIPAWAAWITIAAQPLHFVAAVILGSHPLDLVAWGMNAVGFAAVSLAILRMSDESWSPRPSR